MSSTSSIEWTDATWNPIRGCTKVSPGCKHCYAETFAERWRGVAGHPYEQGFDLRLVPEKLDEPLRWRKPRRVFVNSMSDLFQDGVPDEYLDHCFAVMEIANTHTYQILTKRPRRMRDYFSDPNVGERIAERQKRMCGLPRHTSLDPTFFPLPNVWLGVSTENQETADERIPLLLQTPAAVRFVSAEPLLGPINFSKLDLGETCDEGCGERVTGSAFSCAAHCGCCVEGDEPMAWHRLDWIITGGESGPGARLCDVAWIRSIVKQCRDAEVACFVKQLGRRPFFEVVGDESPKEIAATWNLRGTPEDRVLWDDAGECWLPQLRSRKGADSSEWPEDLRVQEFPNTNGAARPRIGG